MYSFLKPDKKRPVLILPRADNRRLNTVSIAPITSTVRGDPSEIAPGAESGLKHTSAVNLHHVATVPLAGLRSFVGVVSPQTIKEVREALLFALSFIES